MSIQIQSLQRAMAILEYIAVHQGAGVSELSREMSLNKSTVFSILKTFVALGYLFKNEMTGQYQITFRLHSLVGEDPKPGSFISYARPHLQKIAQKYDETVHFVTGDENTVVYIDKLESTKPIRIHTVVGAEQPLHCTAVGKAILAWRDENEIIAYAKRTGLKSMTENSITDIATLLQEMKKIREQGFSIDDEENQPDLYCIGMPVFNDKGKALYAISLSMPKYRKDELVVDEVVNDLKQTAQELNKFF
ncbi:MAG TPA: IclR family transcriptional regulator [Clostridia bacterium]|nr:IclR family transcriptional regulator [Clostridia bacterium]HPY44191.1 IclR family transcriptional regulator [Clostridia bacterium]HQO56899.1 IclR family transcriptional regulator [Clostridia bacterium]